MKIVNVVHKINIEAIDDNNMASLASNTSGTGTGRPTPWTIGLRLNYTSRKFTD